MGGQNKPKGRNLRESASFAEAVEILGGAEIIDEAMESLVLAIAARPEIFDIIPGFKSLRMAKTDPITHSDHDIPPCRLTFRIVDDENVELLWIEQIPDEE